MNMYTKYFKITFLVNYYFRENFHGQLHLHMCIRRKVFLNNSNNCNFISVDLLNISALIVSGYSQMFIKQGVGLKDFEA